MVEIDLVRLVPHLVGSFIGSLIGVYIEVKIAKVFIKFDE